MNCQEFERAINDLAREPLMEATQRVNGLAHAEACARCAARLASEQSLTMGLRSLATSMQQAQAPERVETALLAAFRERDKVIQLRPTAQPLTRAGRPYGRWATSIAAGLALLFAAFAATRLQQPPTQPQTVASARRSEPVKLARWPSAEAVSRTQPEPQSAASMLPRGPQPSFQRVSNRTRNSMNLIERDGGLVKNEPGVNTAQNALAGDIATDFIPLTYGGDLSALDSGRVVRVELPRTAMARFGLPVNAEHAAEPVKADVLLGDDGMAQAIRFIR
jgi:hypothetical protein